MRSLYGAVFVFCLVLVAGMFGLADVLTGTSGPASKKQAPPAAAQSASPATLPDALLALMENPQEEVRLGAMLLSVHAADPQGRMVAFISASQRAEEGALSRTVKNYALASLRGTVDDSLRFIREFPDDPRSFLEVVSFDGRVMGHTVGGVMVELFSRMTSCQEQDARVRQAARSRLPALEAAQTAAGYAAEILPDALEMCP